MNWTDFKKKLASKINAYIILHGTLSMKISLKICQVLCYEIPFSGIFCQENWCLPVYVWILQQEAAQQPGTG